jgi:predicted nucleic acid-binding protein
LKGNERFLLNTDVLFETRRASMHPNVARFLKETSADKLFLSPLSLGELRRQARDLREIEPETAARFENWLDEAKAYFEERFLAVDGDVAEAWSAVRTDGIRSVAASLIAATAASNNLILLTRNAKEATGMNVRTLNPWHTAYRTRPAPSTGDAS